MTAPISANGGLHQTTHFPSPITRVLALGYYDGPVNGLLQCGPNGPHYKFDLLTWDIKTQDLRIFSLAQLPSAAWQQLTEAYERFWEPRWPIWCPLWQFPTEVDRNATERLTKDVLDQAESPTWVIAATDLLGEIQAAKATNENEIRRVTDWCMFLGLDVASLDLPVRSTISP